MSTSMSALSFDHKVIITLLISHSVIVYLCALIPCWSVNVQRTEAFFHPWLIKGKKTPSWFGCLHPWNPFSNLFSTSDISSGNRGKTEASRTTLEFEILKNFVGSKQMWTSCSTCIEAGQVDRHMSVNWESEGTNGGWRHNTAWSSQSTCVYTAHTPTV